MNSSNPGDLGTGAPSSTCRLVHIRLSVEQQTLGEPDKAVSLHLANDANLRAAVQAIGNWVTNLLTLNGVIFALSVTVLPKTFSSAGETVVAILAVAFLVVMLISGFWALAEQVNMLSNGKGLDPTRSLLKRLALSSAFA